MKKFTLEDLDAIIFDLGGVILNLDYELTIQSFKSLGEERFDEFYTQAKQSDLIDQYEKGEISTSIFVSTLKNMLSEKVTEEQIKAAWNVMLLDLPEHRIVFLEQIGAQLPIFLFSNTNDLHYQAFTAGIQREFGNKELLDQLFVQTYFSHLVGKRKPDAEAFQLVLQNHQLQADKVLFIDDSIQHIEGAKIVGLQTYHLQDEDISQIFEF